MTASESLILVPQTQSAFHPHAQRNASRCRDARLERLKTVGRVADPLIWFSESGFIGVYPWPEFFPGLEPINQPIDDVCQRCGAGDKQSSRSRTEAILAATPQRARTRCLASPLVVKRTKK